MKFVFRAKDIEIRSGNQFNIERWNRLKTVSPNKWIHLESEEVNRSFAQNKLYWKYLGMIEYETGNLAQDIHEYAKRKFLPPKIIKINDREYEVPASTTSLKKHEFSDYLDKISAWSGVALPDTKEYKEKIFNESLEMQP